MYIQIYFIPLEKPFNFKLGENFKRGTVGRHLLHLSTVPCRQRLLCTCAHSPSLCVLSMNHMGGGGTWQVSFRFSRDAQDSPGTVTMWCVCLIYHHTPVLS